MRWTKSTAFCVGTEWLTRNALLPASPMRAAAGFVPPPARLSFGLGARACLLLEDVAAEQVEREDLRN
jgi:hypothetical protein